MAQGADSYDYIIVGAGSSGSAIANRLTANGKHQVLLLEAGRASHPWSPIPVGFARLINNPAANWCYEAEPEEATKGRRMPVPRGRLLGGSSAINGMVFVRGQSHDYDMWAQLGNRGWSYREVLPLFQGMESYARGDDSFRGRDGPLKVTDVEERGPLYDALFAAGEHVGWPRNNDYNGAQQDGMSMTQATISNGRRMSTAHCFLQPAKSRPNLTIRTETLTERLLLEDKRCVGVRFSANGRTAEAKARREVIVSTGSINSPQLLELSGIGQPEVLHEHGIEVCHSLPGVGENLRDHYAPRMIWDVSARGLTYNEKAKGLGLVWEVLRYGLTRRGFLSLPATPIRSYIRTREGLDAPDACVSFFPFTANENFQLRDEPGVTVVVTQLRPDSTGSIHIKSPDPQAPPAIRFNFLSASGDAEVLVSAVRETRRFMAAPTMAAVLGEERSPGRAQQSDEEIVEWIKDKAETTYHPVGTCKMGSDPMAVVDDQLRVHGLQGLRVADASIMPTMTSGNTNAPSIMIGEKAAKMILAAAA